MMKKTVLAAIAAATFAVAGLGATAPAEAGYWRHGVWYPVVVAPRYYGCHWEVRRVEFWRHGYLHVRNERVRVCD